MALSPTAGSSCRFARRPKKLSSMPLVVRLFAVVAMTAALAVPADARAQTAWQETFEGRETSWRDAGGDAPHRIVRHERVSDAAHAGRGCEWLQLEANGGEKVYIAHDVGHPRIIEDLTPSVWMKSDRSGPGLLLRVVLPRSTDPRTGQPLSTILQGPSYTDQGRWQQLQMTGLPTLLTRQLHVLRMQFGPQVDGREAYVDAVLLNVYSGPGRTNVWIDDLEIAGHVGTEVKQAHPSTPSPVQPASWTDRVASTAGPAMVPVRLPPVQDRNNATAVTPTGPEAAVTPIVTPAPRRSVKLVQSVLQVNDRPVFPRIIQHRGEPLAFLKKLGFTAVWLERLPTPELLEEADRLGLWVICPPPRELTPIATIPPVFDSVLAWDLGNDLGETEVESTRQWAEQVKSADRRVKRPLVCRPRSELRAYSRAADVLLIDRRPLGTSLQMTDYAMWVRRQPLLASPGTPVWTTVQTQPNEALRRQLLVLEPGSAPPLVVPPEQIRLLAYTAVASGSRGVLFVSDTALDAPDADTQQRAMTLELLNLELELMEPWAAAGSLAAMADSNVRGVTGSMLWANRAHLLLPIWSGKMSQCVPPQSAANSLTLVAPGVPEATDVYELTPVGVKPVRHKRVAGGMSVTLDEFGMTAQVLFAQDPLIVGAVHRRAAEVGRRAAQLQRDLAVRKLTTVQALSERLAANMPVPGVPKWLDTARKSLQTCDAQLASGDILGGSQNSQRAMRPLRLVERAYWDVAVKGLSSSVTSPGAVSFDTLPWHWRLVNRLSAVRFGPNRIAGGDFEDIETMMRAGWRYVQHNSPSVHTAVDLTPDAAKSGRLGLRLAVKAVDSDKPPAVVESPPVLFTSPSVQVEAGQIVCIYGWVNVASPITASSDGLLIVDSLGGEMLADRIDQTEGWKQFALYRAAPQSGAICVTFALSGIGEARLDDVAIQVMEAPATAMALQR